MAVIQVHLFEKPNPEMYAGIIEVVRRFALQVDAVREQTIDEIKSMLATGREVAAVERLQTLALLPDLPQPKRPGTGTPR